MSHTLVTFLGRVDPKGGAYPELDYHFPDGQARRAAFVGFPLADWLGVDRLVVLGTAGSMWDHLFEGDVAVPGGEDERLRLMEAVREQRVDQAQLQGLAPELAAALGREVELHIIPTALAEGEQLELLRTLAAVTADRGTLSIDVTHGYRHLPMLALTAAFYLRSLRPALTLHGLWYGAMDPQAGEATVSNLKGLIEIGDWINAWQRFEAQGDYGAISPLIGDHDPELAATLRDAAFHESIHRGQHAQKQIRSARKRLESHPLPGPGALFQPALEAHTAWINQYGLYRKKRDQAYAALNRADYLRASLYGFEAFITKITQRYGRNPDKYQAREESKEQFWHEATEQQRDQYRILNKLRNVLAHGSQPPDREIQQALHSERALHDALKCALDALLWEPGD